MTCRRLNRKTSQTRSALVTNEKQNRRKGTYTKTYEPHEARRPLRRQSHQGCHRSLTCYMLGITTHRRRCRRPKLLNSCGIIVVLGCCGPRHTGPTGPLTASIHPTALRLKQPAASTHVRVASRRTATKIISAASAFRTTGRTTSDF